MPLPKDAGGCMDLNVHFLVIRSHSTFFSGG